MNDLVASDLVPPLLSLHSGITEEDLRAAGVMNPSHIRRILENLPKNWNWLAEVKVVRRPSENWKMRERKKRPVSLQGQPATGFFLLLDQWFHSRPSLSTRRGKCFAAQSAIFIPSPGAPIEEGFWFEWKVFGYWHLNKYWLNNRSLVGFLLKTFFSMKTAAFSGGKREPFSIVLSAGSCPLLCYYRSGFCACKGSLIKLCKAQNP